MSGGERSPAWERFKDFKAALPRTPRLAPSRVKVRGLEIAVWCSPPVAGTLPLLCVNGGMIYSHNLLWPALAAFAHTRQVILYDQRGRGASQVPPAPLASRIEFDAGDIPALREALGLVGLPLRGYAPRRRQGGRNRSPAERSGVATVRHLAYSAVRRTSCVSFATCTLRS